MEEADDLLADQVRTRIYLCSLNLYEKYRSLNYNLNVSITLENLVGRWKISVEESLVKLNKAWEE